MKRRQSFMEGQRERVERVRRTVTRKLSNAAADLTPSGDSHATQIAAQQ